MNDMAATTTVKSDQINAADLLGGPVTVTIERVNIDLNNDQPVSMRIVGMEKVYRPCKIMRRVMVENWGGDANQYVGRSLTLYCDPNVRFGKDQPGGTRISHMSHIDGEKIATLMVSKGKFAPHRIRPLVIEKPKAAPQPADLPDHDTALYLARKEAERGTDAFRKWWNSDTGKDQRQVLTTDDKAALKQACDDADAARDSDPFGLPPLTDQPTPEQLAAAEAAALAAFAKEPTA